MYQLMSNIESDGGILRRKDLEFLNNKHLAIEKSTINNIIINQII